MGASAAKPRTAPLALSVQQACASLGISWDTWRAHVEPDLPIVRIGRRKLVAVTELQRWLDDHAESSLGKRMRPSSATQEHGPWPADGRVEA